MARYVAGYVKCQNGKVDSHSKQTNLVPMPRVEHPFEKIAIDFAGELPELGGFNAILVVRDQLNKV